MKSTLFLILLFSFLSACASDDETSVIRNTIQDGAALAEKHDIRALTRYLTPDFTARPGDLGPKALRGVLFRAFQSYGNFKIYYPRPLVDVGDSNTSAEATVYFVILRKDHVLPGLKALYDDPEEWMAAVSRKADLYELELTFTKKSGSWKVRRVRMNPLKGMSP